MRVRPLYWMLFGVCCIGLLTFAMLSQERVPALLHVGIQRHNTSETILTISLKDMQDLPIQDAQIAMYAEMKNMVMPPTPIHISDQAQGVYIAYLGLAMKGSWIISISVHANGFFVPRQALCLQVKPFP